MTLNALVNPLTDVVYISYPEGAGISIANELRNNCHHRSGSTRPYSTYAIWLCIVYIYILQTSINR
jgi:hypothetical protein